MLVAITRSNGYGVELCPTIKELLQISQADDFLVFDTSKLKSQLAGLEPITGYLTRTVKVIRVGRHALGVPSGYGIEFASEDIALPTGLIKALNGVDDKQEVCLLLASLTARQLL